MSDLLKQEPKGIPDNNLDNVKVFKDVGLMRSEEVSLDDNPDYKLFLNNAVFYFRQYCVFHDIQIKGDIIVDGRGNISAKSIKREGDKEIVGTVNLPECRLEAIEKKYKELAALNIDVLEGELTAFDTELAAFYEEYAGKDDSELTPEEQAKIEDVMNPDSERNLLMERTREDVEKYYAAQKLLASSMASIESCTDTSKASRNELIFVIDDNGEGKFIAHFNDLYVLGLFLAVNPELEDMGLEELIAEHLSDAYEDFMGVEGITSVGDASNLGDVEAVKEAIMNKIKNVQSKSKEDKKLGAVEKLLIKVKMGTVDKPYFAEDRADTGERPSMGQMLNNINSALSV